MRRSCVTMVGAVLVAATFTGCGGGDSAAAPGTGFLDDASTSAPFKSTDLTPFADMQNQMKDRMKKNDYTVKTAPPKEKTEKGK
ncbi:MAG: hypothetical protein ACLQGP_01105 [Isosphaeraceae bacterium]